MFSWVVSVVPFYNSFFLAPNTTHLLWLLPLSGGFYGERDLKLGNAGRALDYMVDDMVGVQYVVEHRVEHMVDYKVGVDYMDGVEYMVGGDCMVEVDCCMDGIGVDRRDGLEN